MRLSDVPVGVRVILRENMDKGTGMIRETHYVRVGGDARYANNVPVARVRAMQGIPGERPIWDTGERHSWSEASGAIQVEPFETAILLAPVGAAPPAPSPFTNKLVWSPEGLPDCMMVVIPPEIVEALDLNDGQLADITVEDGRIIVTPIKDYDHG